MNSAVPALVFARPYLAGATASRAVGALTAAFLLAMTGLLAARDVITFLAFWELMTLLPAAAILVTRRDDPVRAAVFADDLAGPPDDLARRVVEPAVARQEPRLADAGQEAEVLRVGAIRNR